MAVLLPLSQKGWISCYRMLEHFNLYKQLLIDMKPVCKFRPGSCCVNFYTQLVTDIYHLECNYYSVHLNFIQFMQTVFEDNKKCGTLSTDDTDISKVRVWNRLDVSIQSFILTACLFSHRYLVSLIKWFGLHITLYAFAIKYWNLHKKKRGRIHMVYPYCASLRVYFWNVLALFNWNSAYIYSHTFQIYIPSTLFVLVLFFCCCHGTVYRLILSYLFRIWCIILYCVVLVKVFF